MNTDKIERPTSPAVAKITQTALNVAGGAVPYIGGFLSTIASNWSESEQEKVNDFFQYWLQMLKDEIAEKGLTIVEIMSRLDLQDQAINERLKSADFQRLVKKAFRQWAGAEAEEKRVLIRNILVNAAAAEICSDDVIRLFLDWVNTYSELHFKVISAIYNTDGISRGAVWSKIGKQSVAEDSADADLYKLLFRDITLGGIVRQKRQKDAYGRFLKSKSRVKSSSEYMESAFEATKPYELTKIGQQFVHYAMTDLPLKIDYKPDENVN